MSSKKKIQKGPSERYLKRFRQKASSDLVIIEAVVDVVGSLFHSISEDLRLPIVDRVLRFVELSPEKKELESYLSGKAANLRGRTPPIRLLVRFFLSSLPEDKILDQLEDDLAKSGKKKEPRSGR